MIGKNRIPRGIHESNKDIVEFLRTINMPKSKIIKEIVENKIPIDQALTRLLVLAKDINDSDLEEWAKKELYGYGESDTVPDYRKVICGDIRYSGINGNFQVTNIPLPQSFIGEDFYKEASKVTINDGIKIVEAYSITDKPITRDLTFLAGNVATVSGGEVICTSIEQMIPKATFDGVCQQVKREIIDALCDMEKSYGILDRLAITTEKVSENSNDTPVVQINMPPKERETWASKLAWKFIIPIITAIIGAVTATLIIKHFGL